MPEWIFDTFDERGSIAIDIAYEDLDLVILMMLVREGDEGATAYLVSDIRKEMDQNHHET